MSAALDQQAPAAPPRLSPVPRALWAASALIVLVATGIVAGIEWAPAGDGLPDAGRLVVDGLPVVRLATLLSGGAVLGFGLSGIALDPGCSSGRLTRSGRRDLNVAAVAAGLLAVSSLLLALLTLADVLGLGLSDVATPAIVSTYIWDLEGSRAQILSGVLAVVVAIGLARVRSLGAAASWWALGGIAVGIPSLTGHAAGLGGHSLALVSGFLHAVATSVWGGGVVAVATHAVFRRPGMAERVRRFGVVAVICLVAICITGVAAAATRLEGPGQLLTTEYGRMVLAKVAALVIAAGLGAMVRRTWSGGVAISRPDVGPPDGGQRAALPAAGRAAGIAQLFGEVVVLGGALGLAVVLARSPFPRASVYLPSVGEDLIGYLYPPAPTFKAVALGWHADWVWLAGSLLAIGLYLSGFALLRARGDGWPAGRLVSWLLGWGVVIWATCAGVGWYAPVSFTLHMISHMALAMLAPVLLVLGGPITLALRVIPAASGGTRGPREWITWALHTRLTRFLTHPAYVLLIYTVGLYGLYYTDLYAWLMSTHLGHFAMQVHFLASGYLFYWVVIGVDAGPRRLPYSARLILLMASLVIHSFFAVPMMMTETAMVPGWYAVVRPPWLLDQVADTRVAGAIAWGFGELPTLVVAIALGFQWAHSDEREARRRDRRADLDGDAELRAYNDRLARLDAATRDRPRD